MLMFKTVDLSDVSTTEKKPSFYHHPDFLYFSYGISALVVWPLGDALTIILSDVATTLLRRHAFDDQRDKVSTLK